MSYEVRNLVIEELLELGEKIGSVSKGLKQGDFDKIPMVDYTSELGLNEYYIFLKIDVQSAEMSWKKRLPV